MNKELVTALSICIQARRPVFLWGDPGIGKTSYVNAIGRAIQRHVETVITSIREPSDFAGLPVIANGQVRLAAPQWVHTVCDLATQDAPVHSIVFLDEANQAPPAVQAALQRPVLENCVGETPLPKSVAWVMAGNPNETAASAWDLAPAFANRIVHLSWLPDVAIWTDGMKTGFRDPQVPVLPKGWTKTHLPLAKASVAEFVKANPALLLSVPKTGSVQASRGWPSPRSWFNAAVLIGAAQSIKAGEAVLASLIIGTVGEGAGLEYLSWLRDQDLPTVEAVLQDPKTVIKLRSDLASRVLQNVVEHVAKADSDALWADAWKTMSAISNAGKSDLAVQGARMLVQHPLLKSNGTPKYSIPVQLLDATLTKSLQALGV